MRVIDCDCGETLSAANDDDLVNCVRKHVEQDHGNPIPEDEARQLVQSRAYDASDS